MAEEKLPKELAAKQSELQIYEKVINQRNISREHLSELQEQVNHHLRIRAQAICHGNQSKLVIHERAVHITRLKKGENGKKMLIIK